MSSYNENLNASVVSSLQAQELKLNNTQTKLNAGMFTLYYAEDAKITAQEKLKRTEKKYSAQEIIKEEAVGDNNLSTNVIATANQEKEFNLQSVSNTAVAAANVQIATNAIVNLASDMGSIVSILNAADYGSQIYEQALAVNKLMNDTAYNAEVTSQKAMEASSLTAEVTASTVADMATTTGASVTNLLSILNSQLETISALEITENAAFTAAATAQKKAEGELIDARVEYDAANATYLSSINELNLNLQVTDKTNTDFTVQFNTYQNPFYVGSETSPYNTSPVENYYVFVVKESEKSIFSITTAEGLLTNPEIAFPINGEGLDAKTISQTISMADLKDSSDHTLVLGENYVIFVLVQFTVDYKKSLNNFEDFLTAASSSFVLTTPLNSPSTDNIKVNFLAADENPDNVTTQVLQFNLNQESKNVEYRCMFLLNNSTLVNQMFKTEDLLSVENQILKEINAEINNIKDEADEIKAYNNKNLLHSLTNKLKTLTDKKEALNQTNDADDADVKKKSKKDTTDLDTQISELNARIKELTSIDLRDINPAISKGNINSQNKTPQPGFFFNQLIAENVTDGNYTVPSIDQIQTTEDTTTVVLPIQDNTTDNFGNPLIEGNEYIPVILTVASGPKKLSLQYSNSISDFKNTEAFNYSTKNTTSENN
ncbi:hypothetical protein FIA58_004460 [Flavobacterium jejuense]|uniref:Uncharacterized protein n=1 Tax=Flavobacterium jejuense TaxID=1544455 RepID=A0ABX0IMI3_9FLAO|nr:hypothetical protein [Flavobacterium jejuense]NHN24923.1 hypothetical protein [Flavobacterium jejuense]